MKKQALFVLGLLLLLLGASCKSSEAPELSGGVLATFEVSPERFSVFITNPVTVEQVLALSRGQSEARIPNGRILRGQVSYNKPWHWHLDTEDIEMADMTVELCDGRPSDVENNLDYWVDTVFRFCPWTAQLVELKDYR